LLLGAATRILACCFQAASAGEQAYNILVNGVLQHARQETSPGLQAESAASSADQQNSSNGLVTATEAVVLLVNALVSGGTWWQEAKANNPLLLIETLHTTAMVGDICFGRQQGEQGCSRME
jgi:hypothetical protein